MATMTGRERMLAALRGEEVDRVPVWGREGHHFLGDPPPADDFALGWMAEPLYRELAAATADHLDGFAGWGVPALNRIILVPPDRIVHETVHDDGELRRVRHTIPLAGGDLVGRTERRRGENTGWTVEPLVKRREDLVRLAEVPFAIDPALVAVARRDHAAAVARGGDRAAPLLGVSSPVVCISGCMEFALFLELSFTDPGWFAELLEEITRRTLAVLAAVWEGGAFDTAANLGGSEQCTPPMMAPDAFDRYVVPYDGRIVAFLKERGCPVKMHCHGKVRHALTGMLAMGVDGTDPVEAPPSGDVTFAEAKAIAGDGLTLFGNLQYDELCRLPTAAIVRQVEEILSHGPRRTVVAASAGPISAVEQRFVDNFKAVVETVVGR